MLELYTPNCTDNHLVADGMVIFLPFNVYYRKRKTYSVQYTSAAI